MIKFENVTKIYLDEFTSLRNITLTINDGEFVSIIGKTGAGKSTFLKLIYAEEFPTEGVVFFGDRPTTQIKHRLLPFYRRNFGTIFQDFKLLPYKTVFENVSYALEVEGESDEEINDKVPKILELVGLGNKSSLYPHQLSGGERQKVSIARALIHQPKVIIADEPTGNLDPNSAWEIVRLLLRINELGTTVLLATHNKDIVDKVNRRVITIEDGAVVSDVEKGKYFAK